MAYAFPPNRGPLGTETWDDTLRNGAVTIEDTNAAEQAQRDQADNERYQNDNRGGYGPSSQGSYWQQVISHYQANAPAVPLGQSFDPVSLGNSASISPAFMAGVIHGQSMGSAGQLGYGQ